MHSAREFRKSKIKINHSVNNEHAGRGIPRTKRGIVLIMQIVLIAGTLFNMLCLN